MGCPCSKTKKPVPLESSPEKLHLNQTKISYTGKISDKVTITQSLFVGEKTYNKFMEEYDQLEFIGQGAFGTVQKVKHKITNQIRAMKTINKSAFKNAEDESKLLKEIEILKKLNHPNILKLYEFFTEKKSYYMVTEYYNGGELFQKINDEGCLTEKLAAKIMKNILLAIGYCHSIDIVHRDIKPENILLEFNEKDKDNFSIKLIDFGASQVITKGTYLKDITGTPYYIAPEVLNKKYTEKCDIWSCGIILYILLSGEPPFNGSTDEEILSNIKIGVFNFSKNFNNISDDAKDLISKMLTFDPAKRYSAAQALDSKWIKDVAPNAKLNIQSSAQILKRLKSFRADRKLQEATISFLVTQYMSKDDTNELKRVFMEMDKNGDGKLSLEEVAEGYKKVFRSPNPEADAKLIFNCVDSDNNGYISYEEFIRATIDKKKLLTEKKLESAFRLFDKNGDGFISAKEIKDVLGKDSQLSDDVWNQIVKEVDVNGDGEISLEEFKQMMLYIIDK